MRRSVFAFGAVLGAALGLVTSAGAFAKTKEAGKHAVSHKPKKRQKAISLVKSVDDGSDAETSKDRKPTKPKPGRGESSSVCVDRPVVVQAGSEREKVTLTKCNGDVLPRAIAQMSVLVRPPSSKRPTLSIETLSTKKGKLLAPGIRRVSDGVVVRLAKIVRHFSKPGETTKIHIVSGYKPRSVESSHAAAKALDLRIDGVKNEALVAFCKKLDDTGCGFYPNSQFVHIDERDKGAGHVAWIDASRPGEAARYVKDWPIPTEKAAAAVLVSVDEKKERPGLFEEPLDDEGLW